MDKFKNGDKVVCVNIKGLSEMLTPLKINHTYIVESTFITELSSIKPVIILKNISGAFSLDRFIGILECRKQKMEKILNKYLKV